MKCECGAKIPAGAVFCPACGKAVEANETETTKEKAKKVLDATAGALSTAGNKTKEVANKSKDAVIKAIDQNGNGEIDIEDVIILGLRTPGVKINRANFLQKELFKNHTQEEIDKVIATTPASAGISSEEIERIANEVIKFERNCVSGISTALGMPGGVAMVATIPADIAQYYGYLLRATQKLLYLYGFPEIDVEEKGQKFDTETINILIICMGIMYGAAGAENAIKGLAKALAAGVEKKLLKTALTKTTFYPLVKNVAKWFGVKMTKEVFAGFFKKAIPVVGGVVGGGITYLSFKPCCDKLKKSLEDTMLSNPNHVSTPEEDAIEIEAEEVVEEDVD